MPVSELYEKNNTILAGQLAKLALVGTRSPVNVVPSKLPLTVPAYPSELE